MSNLEIMAMFLWHFVHDEDDEATAKKFGLTVGDLSQFLANRNYFYLEFVQEFRDGMRNFERDLKPIRRLAKVL